MLLLSERGGGSPAVFGVAGLDELGTLGDLFSGKGSDDELRRASTACRSRCEGRVLSSGCRRTDLEELALFNELARPDFDEEASPPGGALNIRPDSFSLDLADAVAVVLLRAILCCA